MNFCQIRKPDRWDIDSILEDLNFFGLLNQAYQFIILQIRNCGKAMKGYVHAVSFIRKNIFQSHGISIS